MSTLTSTIISSSNSFLRPNLPTDAAAGMARRIGAAAAAAAAAPSRLSGTRSQTKGKLSSGRLHRLTFIMLLRRFRIAAAGARVVAAIALIPISQGSATLAQIPKHAGTSKFISSSKMPSSTSVPELMSAYARLPIRRPTNAAEVLLRCRGMNYGPYSDSIGTLSSGRFYF